MEWAICLRGGKGMKHKLYETMLLTLVLAVGGIALLFCLPLSQELFAIGAAVIVCAAVSVCLLELFFLRKMLVAHTEKLLDTLDDMIVEKEEIHFPEYHDTLTVKIQDRMKQYHEIMLHTREENQKEKEMIQSMVSDIAHQMRTPAANLKLFAEILGRNNLSGEKKEQFLPMVEEQTEKINFLMDAMTEMSRLETGLVSLHQKRQSLLDTLAEAMSEVMPKALKKEITVTVSCPEETELVHDRRWTVEAVFNLLDNAVKYTGRGGKIRIEVHQGQFYTKINISDTGRGIAAEHLNKIFQRFYREPEAEGEEGIGLGLHLAKEIIEMEKGYISVASVVGEGTTFSVYLLNEPKLH